LCVTARLTALNARKARSRRVRTEAAVRSAPTPGPNPLDQMNAAEFLLALDEELGRLPDRYRGPLVLCCLEGLSRDEAAGRLCISTGTLNVQLERGRERLRARLSKRGIDFGALLLAVSAAPVAALAQQRIVELVRGASAGCVVPPAVAALIAGNTVMTKMKLFLATVLLVGVGAVGFGGQDRAPTGSDSGLNPADETRPLPQFASAARAQDPDEVAKLRGEIERLKKEIELLRKENELLKKGIKPQPDGADGLKTRDKDLDLLKGTWDIDAMQWGRGSLPKDLMTGYKFVFDGNKLTWNGAIGNMSRAGKISAIGDAVYNCTFKIDSGQDPKQIEITMPFKKGEVTIRGIYEIKGDTLKVCYFGGDTGKRPTEFATKEGVNIGLIVLTRAKK
jgi:uncharacterized protein (TIGR03067 family)